MEGREDESTGERGTSTAPRSHGIGLRRPLFVAGDTRLFARPFVAVVGTRRASARGIASADAVARELTREGIVVASGLAAGIDGAAHRAAMLAGGRTVAVIGTPLDRCYPAAHAALQARIARDHLLVSPFEWGATVTRGSFPQRDRVLAALCEAVIVIEASDGSGTLHTVDAAVRLGRPVFIAEPALAQGSLWAERLLAAKQGSRLDAWPEKGLLSRPRSH